MNWRFWKKTETLGQQGERIAAESLCELGYVILDRNVKLGRYEIDLIAQEGDTIAFVEVKTRRDDSFLRPETNVHQKKRQHLLNAARLYIAHNRSENLYYRFDIVSVVLPENEAPRVRLIRNAFPAE